MTSVWYVGKANKRVISSSDWAGAGVAGASTSTWDKTNGYSIPASDFTADQIAILDRDPSFVTDAPDGPRSPTEPAANSDPLPDYVRKVDLYDGSGKLLEDKLPDRLDPTSLNAAYAKKVKPSGDTTGAKDTAAIQANEDAGENTALVPGTYYVSGLVKKSGTYIYLNGATMLNPNGANGDVVVAAGFAALMGTGGGDIGSGVTKAGIIGPGVIDGNKSNQTTATTTVTTQATLPTGTLTVGSTAGFPASGSLTVLSSSGMQTVRYTGTTATTFTGCTGGGGAVYAGTPVYFAGYGIRGYWFDMVLGGAAPLEIRNCVADGLWSEWGAGGTTAVKNAGAMESNVGPLKLYSNGRNGATFAGPHDSWIKGVQAFGNGVAGLVTTGAGVCYISHFHGWGSPQAIALDAYTETHVAQGACEVNNVVGSIGLRVNGIAMDYRGRVFTPPGGAPYGGNIGILMQGNASRCDIDAQVQDCNNGALVVYSDGGHNRIRLTCNQTDGPAVVRLMTSVAAASNGVDVSTFAGAGTLTVASTTNFPASGGVMVGTLSGPRLVTYTGKTSTTLTGCRATGAGVLSTGGTVTVCNVLNGKATNDLANVSLASTLDIIVNGGATCPGVDTRNQAVKRSAAVYPDPVANTYGAPLTITAPNNAPGLAIDHIGAYGATGLAAGEYLNFQVVATYTDGTTYAWPLSAGSHQVGANGGGMTCTNDDFYPLFKDGSQIYSLAISCKSTIAASAAHITGDYAGKM